LTQARLTLVRLTLARLTLTRLTLAQLTLIALDLVRLKLTRLTLAQLTLIRLTLVRLTLIRFTLARLSLARLTLARLALARISLARLTLALLTWSQLTLVRLRLARLTLVRLTLAQLTRLGKFFVATAVTTAAASTATITADYAAVGNAAAAGSKFGVAADPFAATSTADLVCFAVPTSAVTVAAASRSDVILTIIALTIRADTAEFVTGSRFKESQRIQRIVAPNIASAASAPVGNCDRAVTAARTAWKAKAWTTIPSRPDEEQSTVEFIPLNCFYAEELTEHVRW
jgi:hypothetical protein